MSGPLRIKFPRAIYHVTLRGDRRELIFVDDGDRHALLTLVAQAMERCNAEVLAYIGQRIGGQTAVPTPTPRRCLWRRRSGPGNSIRSGRDRRGDYAG